jgi:hypothetical protein
MITQGKRPGEQRKRKSPGRKRDALAAVDSALVDACVEPPPQKFEKCFFEHQGNVSDKWEQYLAVYDAELHRFIASGVPVRLLEIGVQNGGSLQIWSQHLPTGSTIVGVDIDPRCAAFKLGQNVRVVIGNGADPTDLDRMLGDKSFHIIIDDASHRSEQVIATFCACFPRLEPGGIYAIEDLHCSYFRDYEGGLDRQGTAIEWLKSLVDSLNVDHLDDNTVSLEQRQRLQAFNREIARITFYDSIAVVEKLASPKIVPYRRVIAGKHVPIENCLKSLVPTQQLRNLVLSPATVNASAPWLLEAVSAAREEVGALRSRVEAAEGSQREVSILWSRAEAAEQRANLHAIELERANREAIARGEAEIENVKRDLALRETDSARLQAELAELTKERARVCAELAQLKEKNEEFSTDLAGKRAEMERLQRALAERSAENDELNAQLTQRIIANKSLLASTSWHVTRPLRWIRERAPWLAGLARSGLKLAWWAATLQLVPRLRASWSSRCAIRLIDSSGLFDRGWYLDHNPDVRIARVDPVMHYLRAGAAERRNPSVLFDADWYLTNNPDVRAAGVNPLLHYLRHGNREGRIARRLDVPLGPTPSDRAVHAIAQSSLFDKEWYLRNNPDVAASGIDPIRHYVLCGASEGRDPSPRFSTRNYLLQNPDVSAAGLDPLLHFLLHGAAEGRKGGTFDDGNRLTSTSSRGTSSARAALVNYAPPKELSVQRVPMPPVTFAGFSQRPAVLCLTHVAPYPPRAGNEYRIHRILSWLTKMGWDIVIVLCPLPNEEMTEAQIRDLCAVYPNVIVLRRDGAVWHHVARPDAAEAVASINGTKIRDFSLPLQETDQNAVSRIVSIARTFCPDALVEVVLTLEASISPGIVLANYVFMTRVFPLLRSDAFKVIDTHDVFSTKRGKVSRFGLNSLELTQTEEAELLSRGDLAIAIQPEEAEELRRIVPSLRIATAGVDFSVNYDQIIPESSARQSQTVLIIASQNKENEKGVGDFLRFAWPIIRREVSTAELHIVGPICDVVHPNDARVHRLGRVDDLSTVYAQAGVVVNPNVAGTGLKIKTLESLGHLRPIVSWPSGVEGLSPELRSLCVTASDWFEFAYAVITLLSDNVAAKRLIELRQSIEQLLSSETVYAELACALPKPIFPVHKQAR